MKFRVPKRRLLAAKVLLGWLGVGSGVGCGAPPKEKAPVTHDSLVAQPKLPAPAEPALAPPLAADSLGLHAMVITIADSVPGDPEYQVHLPQVHLPTAAVARRINTVLVQQLAEITDTVLPAAARQAVRLARPILCNHRGGNASGGLLYRVCYNAHGLLSLEFEVQQSGQSIEAIHHLTFDLRTGSIIHPADLLASPQALAYSLRQRRMARRAAQVALVAEELPDDPAMRAQLGRTLHQLDTLALDRTDFYLTRHGIVFFENLASEFPPAHYNLAPEPEYAYSFKALRPWRRGQGPWQASDLSVAK